jgi:hypothetical protein
MEGGGGGVALVGAAVRVAGAVGEVDGELVPEDTVTGLLFAAME